VPWTFSEFLLKIQSMNLPRLADRKAGIPGKVYWSPVSPGLFIGFRRNKVGGVWLCRLKRPGDGTKYIFGNLGIAQADLTGKGMPHDAALTACLAWAKQKAAQTSGEFLAGDYSILDAVNDYLDASEAHKGVKLERTRSSIGKHVVGPLASIQLRDLKHSHLLAWFSRLGSSESGRLSGDDLETLRKRRATANRVWATLRAALNQAFKNGRVESDAAWRRITTYRSVNAPKIRFLTLEETAKLIRHCPVEFRPMVRAALYTGARYGELCRLRVGDFQNGSLRIERSKSGKPRWIPLTTSGEVFFSGVCTGRQEHEFMFAHMSGRRAGEPWEHTQQTHYMKVACRAAGIRPTVGFHLLRHAYASHLAERGVSLQVIAALLGHSDTRMTETHYAHLAESHVSQQLRANLPDFALQSVDLQSKSLIPLG
jgi:integrase